jgi:hypothetical protein
MSVKKPKTEDDVYLLELQRQAFKQQSRELTAARLAEAAQWMQAEIDRVEVAKRAEFILFAAVEDAQNTGLPASSPEFRAAVSAAIARRGQ